jgi:dihydrolipoamide dehydrogenase
MSTIEVKVPDIGGSKDVNVIEVMIKPGDTVAKEQSLITLESDKASMDVPSSAAGVVKAVHLKVGDKVSEGSLILTLEGAVQTAAPAPVAAAPAAPPVVAPIAATPKGAADVHAEVVVIGSGPGGYTAAFRAADLGKKVVLVERYPGLGGVCLNVGCIPSKALLHTAKVIDDVEDINGHGLTFGKPKIDINGVRDWKNKVVGRLTQGIKGLAKQRKVDVIQGVAQFSGANQLAIEGADGKKTISFDYCIIAAGSQPTKIPGFPHDDPRMMDSTGALELADIPKRLLVVGGGIIGLEMATVYHSLGSKVTIVEFMDGIIPPADRDIVRPLHKRIEKRYEKIYLKTKVAKIEAGKAGLTAYFEGEGAPEKDTFDRILVSVGRVPNGKKLNAEAAGVVVNERGFIPVDKQMRTNVPHIFAIGDIVGQPMLAHKAVHEGKVAAEVIAGQKRFFDARVIPSVAYTDPEVAWVGLTEQDAKSQNVPFEKASFPWAASGRSLSLGRDEGVTKLLFDPETHRVIGGGIVGPNAGELIAEVTLAIEMGADVHDIGLTIHPHPTLSETVCFAAEVFDGSITDIYAPKKPKAGH